MSSLRHKGNIRIMNESQKLLGTEPIGKLLFKYSMPAIIGMLVNAMYNFVDRYFIGNIEGIGSLAIAGVGITLPVLTAIMAFAIMIAAGAATNMSLRMGEGRNEEAQKIVGNALSLAVITGVVLTAVYFMWGDQILFAFGASAASLEYAQEYMNLLLIGIVPWLVAMTLSFTMRADGSPMRAGVILIVGSVLNVPLDWLFIVKLNMGIGGAALATSLAEIVSMLMCLDYYLRGKSNLPFKYSFMKLEKPLVKMIITLGMTPFIINIAVGISQAVTNNALKIYGNEIAAGGGDLAIGAMTTIGTIVMMFFMPVFGLAQGMQPIVGYNYGARKLKRAKKAFMLTVLWGTAIFTVAIVFTLVFPEYIIRIINDDPELLALTVDGIRKDTFTLPLIAVSVIGSNYILSIGKAKLAMVLSLLRQIVVLVPTLIILPLFLGLDGVWFAQPVGDVVALVITAAVLYYEFRTYKASDKGELKLS